MIIDTLFLRATPAPTSENTAHALDLRLPWPPSLNRLWRAVNNRVLLSATARAFCVAAKNELPKERVIPLTGRLAVQILLCPPASQEPMQRWDIANREKLICDVLTKQRVWLDDSQIDHLTLARGPAFASGRAFVRIDVYHNVTTSLPAGRPAPSPRIRITHERDK